MEDADLWKLKDGDQEAIDRLFRRLERYVTILTDSEFLKFEDLTTIDFAEEEEEWTAPAHASHPAGSLPH